MDTIFPSSTIKYRAITNPVLQHAAYFGIIAAENAIAILCWIGAAVLVLKLGTRAVIFNRAKSVAIAGLTLGILLWLTGFMVIGGEWFGMWMSQQWNGVASASRSVMVIFGVLIFLVLPDMELDPAEQRLVRRFGLR